MSEGSEHAAILIATSYQALNRALVDNPDMLITDCTVLILFAGFYVEATLNYLFEQSGKESQLLKFPQSDTNQNRRYHPGMKDKLKWFYNEFIDDVRANNWKDINTNGIEKKLEIKFPGFAELHSFRNDISHGQINQSAKSLVTAKRLRQQAKDIVNQLYSSIIEKGYNVPRVVTYRDALMSIGCIEPIRMSDLSSTG